MIHEFRVVKTATTDIYIQAETYRHLINEPIQLTMPKTLIVAHRHTMTQESLWTMPDKTIPRELIGYLQDKESSFVSVKDSDYVARRHVFYGQSGLLEANEFLRTVSRIELAESIMQMIYDSNQYS